jgi:hypothetical protein
MPALLALIRIGSIITQLGDVGGDSSQLITPGVDGYGVAKLDTDQQSNWQRAATLVLLKHAVLSAKLVSTVKCREAESIERADPCKPRDKYMHCS